MNAAFLTFTCRRDADLVPLWAHGIRRVLPDAPLIAAVDRVDEDMPLPRKVARLVTDFDRRGNLNGIEAVAGILGTIRQVAELTGLPVVKMDSDTVLAGGAWLNELATRDYVGFEGGHALTATGICYGMTGEGAEKIIRSISPWPWQTDGKFPEDQTIFSLAQMYTRARLHPWNGGHHVLAFMPPHFGQPDALRKAWAAIHCGQAQALAAYGSHLSRTHLVRRMMLTTLRTLSRSASHADKSGQL